MLSLILLLPLLLSSLKCLTSAKQSHETGQISSSFPTSAEKIIASKAKFFLQVRCPDALHWVTAVNSLIPVCGVDEPQAVTTPSLSNGNPTSTNGLSVGMH